MLLLCRNLLCRKLLQVSEYGPWFAQTWLGRKLLRFQGSFAETNAGSVGAFFGGLAVVCGGDAGWGILPWCYKFEAGSWKRVRSIDIKPLWLSGKSGENEKINEIERTQVHSPPRATS
jgi:hypothetical protein